MTDNWSHSFWLGIFRDVDGTASSSRVLTALVVVTTLSLTTFVTVHNKALPDLTPITVFLERVILSLYGVSRISQALTAITARDKSCENNAPAGVNKTDNEQSQ